MRRFEGRTEIARARRHVLCVTPLNGFQPSPAGGSRKTAARSAYFPLGREASRRHPMRFRTLIPFLGTAVLGMLIPWGAVGQAQDQQTAPQDNGVEVLARGPVHEAFAE